MDLQKAIKNLKYMISNDCTDTQFDYIEEIETAIKALEEQMEMNKLQFTNICKSDREIYPSVFSIYARIIKIDKDSVTIERFQKFGCLPVGKLTLSSKDFAKYYKEITNEPA